MNRYVIMTVNYLVASLISLVFILSGDLPSLPCSGSVRAFLNEFEGVMKGGAFSPAGSLGWAVIVGISAGILYYLGFIYLQKAVKESGVSLAGSFSRMGILIPVILSILLFRELPSSLQWAGICLALFSIILANIDISKSAGFLSGFQPVLIMLFARASDLSALSMKAPLPTLTSMTSAPRPAAIFFDNIDAVISGIDATVAVTSRIE